MQQNLFETDNQPAQANFFNDDQQPAVTANVTEGGVRLIFRDALTDSEMRSMRRVLRGVAGAGEVLTVFDCELFIRWYDKKTGDKRIAQRLLVLPAELKRTAESYLTAWRSSAQTSLF